MTKLRILAETTALILLGLLTATSQAYAQEDTQKSHQSADPRVKGSRGMDAYEKLLRDADALIKSGKPAAAYSLLEPIEFEHSGEVRFDYLLGIAALDSGKADRATFAFERVLAVNPDFAAARLDMARAYYQLGDLQRARTEFAVALKQNPSEAARANIQKYLDVIDAQEKGTRVRFFGYLEGSFGQDSNVNSSTNQAQVQVFDGSIWTTATLDTANVKKADNYYSLAVGGEANYDLDVNWGVYAAGDLRKRSNNTSQQFDTLGLEIHAGVQYGSTTNRMRVGAIGGQNNVAGSHSSDSTGFKAEWSHVFSPSNQMNAFAQSARYRFVEPVMRPNDIDQRAMGFGWLHTLPDGRSALSSSVHYGTEKDVAPEITVTGLYGSATPVLVNEGGGRNDGAKRFKGFRAGGEAAVNEKMTLFANAGIQIGDFSKINHYFKRQRNDRFVDVKLGADWHWDRLWILRPQFSYYKNSSNIVIYDYERVNVFLSVRREFR